MVKLTVVRPLTTVDVSRSFRTKVSQGAGDMAFKFPYVIVDLKENGRIEKNQSYHPGS